MLVRFWGTRGSIPSPGPSTARYGGNTSCVEIVSDSGASLILDSGTGIRRLGARIAAEGTSRELQLLLSHCHWDHIQGLPFFEPFGSNDVAMNIRVPAHIVSQADRILQTQFDPLFFPLARADLRARIVIDAAPEEMGFKDMVIRAGAVEHPGGALAYRIEPETGSGRSVVFAPDSEVRRGSRSTPAFEALAAGCKILIHDAMYTESEYESKEGWGHSSHLAAVDLALRAGARLLVIFHHHPDRSDEQVDALVEECRAVASAESKDLLVQGAYEGLELEV